MSLVNYLGLVGSDGDRRPIPLKGAPVSRQHPKNWKPPQNKTPGVTVPTDTTNESSQPDNTK
jgi:hypothetical protein